MGMTLEDSEGLEKITSTIIANQFGFHDLIKKYGSNTGLNIANTLSAGQLGIITRDRANHLIRAYLQSLPRKQPRR